MTLRMEKMKEIQLESFRVSRILRVHDDGNIYLCEIRKLDNGIVIENGTLLNVNLVKEILS